MDKYKFTTTSISTSSNFAERAYIYNTNVLEVAVNCTSQQIYAPKRHKILKSEKTPVHDFVKISEAGQI